VAVAALAALVLGSTALKAEDDLADAARREKERRASQRSQSGTKPAKTYTDADLKGPDGKAAATPSGTPASGAEQAPADEVDSTTGVTDEDGLQKLREGVAAKRAEVASFEATIADIEGRIQQLRNERSLPTRLTEVDRDRSINRDIATANDELEEAKKSLATAREELEALTEEARRAGIPYSQLE
jgi:hypothetical protein